MALACVIPIIRIAGTILEERRAHSLDRQHPPHRILTNRLIFANVVFNKSAMNCVFRRVIPCFDTRMEDLCALWWSRELGRAHNAYDSRVLQGAAFVDWVK